VKSCGTLGRIDNSLFHEIEEDRKFTIKDLVINPMRISHDAAQPVGYRISYGEKKVAICTDLGTYNDYTVECLKGMDALLLEANHDVNMLQVGPYPYYLKQRILGDRGHLSNENSGRLLCRVLHDNLKTVFLGHLSKENNLPELAYESVRMEIAMGKTPYKPGDFDIRVARRSEVTAAVEL
jgi:phosphoribosyl 1,2-cyclic phosphodiesterase